MKIVIPVPEKISLNQALRMGHSYNRFNDVKQEWYWAVSEAKPEPYDGPFPIDLSFHFYLHGTQIDSSNCAFLTKSCEDALVAYGTIPGDSPKFVRWVAQRSDKATKEDDAVVVVHISTAEMKN